MNPSDKSGPPALVIRHAWQPMSLEETNLGEKRLQMLNSPKHGETCMHVRSRDIWATAGLHMPILSNPLHASDFQNFPVKNHGKTLCVSTLRKGICFLETEKKCSKLCGDGVFAVSLKSKRRRKAEHHISILLKLPSRLRTLPISHKNTISNWQERTSKSKQCLAVTRKKVGDVRTGFLARTKETIKWRLSVGPAKLSWNRFLECKP